MLVVPRVDQTGINEQKVTSPDKFQVESNMFRLGLAQTANSRVINVFQDTSPVNREAAKG
jgi:hypothetical protein